MSGSGERPTPAALRAELEELIVGDLLGPAGGADEVLSGAGRVRDRYLVGMLAPKGTIALDPARSDRPVAPGDPAPGDDTGDDGGPAAQVQLFPSSVGLTAAVDANADRLVVDVAWGRYTKHAATSAAAEEHPTVWQREPVTGRMEIVLADGDLGPVCPVADQPGVVVRGRVLRAGRVWLVTVFLVNEQAPPARNKDEGWLFQAQLGLESPDGSAVFVGRAEALDGRPVEPVSGEEVELALLDLAYRRHVELASGHGVAVHAVHANGDPTRATRVETVSMPAHVVPTVEAPGPGDTSRSEVVQAVMEGLVLDMAELGRAEPGEWRAMLEPLADGYEAWLDEQEVRATSGADGLADHAEATMVALGEARTAARRLRAGIATVCPDTPISGDHFDPNAAAAFAFANRAMCAQRVHTLAGAARRAEPDLDLRAATERFAAPEHHQWRPFQLAFLLINLPSLTVPTHPERSEEEPGLVDLLFFPTGGGKTEAYLGLTAYTLAIRRLQGTVGGCDGRSGGVAVLMRYTLRLLTAQQFQRAAALICACELERRRLFDIDDRWGETPFRLGMWVGSSVTPNRHTDAQQALADLRNPGPRRSGQPSPVQLVTCPWCGSRLDPATDAIADHDRWRTLLYCSDRFGRCQFTGAGSPGEGIPVVTVDDEIYRLAPSFVISTADKFAQLPWQGPLHLLFGRVQRRCERHGYRSPDLDRYGGLQERDSHVRTAGLPAAKTVPVARLRPPDLVIQDELHLISGPLGTLVGLYETAVDRLASWEVDGEVVRPKVVASTATVRRAGPQVAALFAREVAVFPPPVLDVEDSFFAAARPVAAATPGRRYLGICAPGERLKTAELRVFTAALAAAQTLWERYGPPADPWMTLVGYFSALRELGGARRLVDDQVRARLRDSGRRGLADRRLRVIAELTSRISSTDIPDVLDQLSRTFEEDDGQGLPIDVLLATSMISVGVDVGRLGLMGVLGQPKTTSEYIQATSRVGRTSAGPGLVLTIYNWARPRDLSHYETFEHYHDTFYRHVEALSVTPFSRRALDRGLTAVMVALARHDEEELRWNANPSAQAVPVHEGALDSVADVVARRAERVSGTAGLDDEVRDMLRLRAEAWTRRQALPGAVIGYREEQGQLVGLLAQPGMVGWDELSAPNSLRETEPTVNLIIGDAGPLGADPGPSWRAADGATRPVVVTDEDEEPPNVDEVDA